jgi:uncharacterized repeat protein (TIGR03803 family)
MIPNLLKVLMVMAFAIMTFSVTTSAGTTLLHEFDGYDGWQPHGSLTLSGSKFYGVTSVGGNAGKGVVFSMDLDGGNYTLLHEFTGGSDDGKGAYGSLTLSGQTLYGMTYYGGDSDQGTVFSIDTDGNNYNLLHEFSGRMEQIRWDR